MVFTDVSPPRDDNELTKKKNDDHWECKGFQSIYNPVQPRVNQAEEGWLKKVENSLHNSFCMQDIFCLVSRPRRMSYPNFWIDAHIWFFWTKRSHYLTGIWRSRQICKLNFTNSESTDLYVCWLCPKQKGFISTKGQHLEKSATGVVCIESASEIRANLEQS